MSNRFVVACMAFFTCEVIAAVLFLVFFLTLSWGLDFDYEAYSGLVNIPVFLITIIVMPVSFLGTGAFAFWGLLFFAEMPEAEDHKKSLALSLLGEQHIPIREVRYFRQACPIDKVEEELADYRGKFFDWEIEDVPSEKVPGFRALKGVKYSYFS